MQQESLAPVAPVVVVVVQAVLTSGDQVLAIGIGLTCLRVATSGVICGHVHDIVQQQEFFRRVCLGWSSSMSSTTSMLTLQRCTSLMNAWLGN